MTTGLSSRVTATTGKKPHYFYGWNIVAASFLVQLSYAEHYTSILGLFFKPLQKEFGWSRSAMAAVQTIARLTEAVVAPVIGPLIDRYGPRVLIPIGAIIVGFSMLGVTRMTAIWQFYLLRGFVVAIGFILMGALVTDVAVNNWFVKKRGRALAISRLGSNLGNFAFVPAAVFVIATYGWRTMFIIFAVVTWLVGVIPSLILMRRRPEDMGLYPDGIASGTAQAEGNREKSAPSTGEITSVLEPVWNRREVMMTGSFWLLVLCFGIENFAFQGINISLAPYIQDLGYGEVMLASILTFRALTMTLALPAMGFLAERTNRVIVRVGPFLVQSGAVLLLFLASEPAFLWVGVALYGLGSSGVMIVQEVIWANYFGRLSLGTVRSLGYLTAFGLGATGPIAMNLAFDVLGSYRPAFIVIIVLFVIASLILGVVRAPKARRYVTAAGLMPLME